MVASPIYAILKRVTALSIKCCSISITIDVEHRDKGAVINFAREGAGREIQNFATNFIAPVRFQFFL